MIVMPPAMFESPPCRARPSATPADANTVRNADPGMPMIMAAATNPPNRSKSAAVVLIGVIRQTRGLTPCGLCGNANCGETLKGSGPCAFDDIDLGIALGSAASLAADFRLDNRILYTAGMAALELKLLGEDVRTVMALPLSASNKNIFFDRK